MSVINFLYSGIVSLTIGITGCLADDVCVNNQNRFYCSTGCCGSYREHHCCSQTGLIVGIVVCIAVIISIVVIYCYIKHRNRKRAQGNFLRPVPHGQPIGCLNNMRRGPPTVAGPVMPGYPPPYDFTITQPPLAPKGPPPAYDSVYRTSAGIGVGACSNPGYPPPVS